MGVFFGAKYNLEELIKTHLFVICATNSGTTFLKSALTTSEKTWNLPREGQQIFGFSGPRAHRLNAHRSWAGKQDWIEELTNAEKYNWDKTKKAWYFQAFGKNKDASVFVEKSPPFVLVVDQLVKNFKNPKFLFVVRNPYAVVEGIRRQSSRKWVKKFEIDGLLTLIATHVITALSYQKKNIEAWANYGVFFTYEQMCDEPEKVEEVIKSLVPEIDDLVLRQKIKVREYNEELRNMNEQQFERLSEYDIKQINEVFIPYEDVLNYFNYSII